MKELLRSVLWRLKHYLPFSPTFRTLLHQCLALQRQSALFKFSPCFSVFAKTTSVGEHWKILCNFHPFQSKLEVLKRGLTKWEFWGSLAPFFYSGWTVVGSMGGTPFPASSKIWWPPFNSLHQQLCMAEMRHQTFVIQINGCSACHHRSHKVTEKSWPMTQKVTR